MQIACYELYEKEKKKNEGKSIGELYNQVYKLGDKSDRFYNLKYTNFVFANTNENVILYLHYVTHGYIRDGIHGRIEYDFYIVENNGEYYLRYFNMRELESKAAKCAKQAIKNVSWCDETRIGVNINEYKKYVLENAMSEKIPINKAELENYFEKIKKVNFKFACGGLNYLEYLYATTEVEMLDFKNNIAFYSDEYVLPKFAPCIDLVEFVFEKSKIPCVKNCNLKYISNLDKAKEILVDKKLREEYCIPY